MLRLYREKKSPYWYVRGTIAGRRICESTGTTDKGQAQDYCRKRDRELYETLQLGRVTSTTWSQAVNAYLDRHGGQHRSLLPLLDRWQGKALTEITQVEVDRAAQELYPNAKASTLHRHVYGPVITVLRNAAKSGMPGAAPPIFEKPIIKRVPVEYATDDYIQKLLPHCAEGLAAAVLLMTLTGLRTGEVVRLTKADFTVRPGWVSVKKTKTGQPAMVPLPESWQWPADGWGYTTSQGFNKALRRAAAAAELPFLSGHKVGRHAFAARLLNAGYDLKLVKEAGRWKKLAIVDEIYGHLEIGRAHDAMRKVGEKLKRK